MRGSSPLTRGKRRRDRLPGRVRGLIPAHAGKTVARSRARWPLPAHPRSRGENSNRAASAALTSGSSPLTRGKPAAKRRARQGVRLIPAHAGKTSAPLSPARSTWAHPRSRGENEGHLVEDAIAWGSSPLTRGKPHRWRVPGRAGRLIPAHAGKTMPWQRQVADVAAHPRSRGENVAHELVGVPGGGSSPLTRGKLRDPPQPG